MQIKEMVKGQKTVCVREIKKFLISSMKVGKLVMTVKFVRVF